MNNIIILDNTRGYNNIPCYSNGDLHGLYGQRIKYPFYTGEWIRTWPENKEAMQDPVLIKNKTDLILNMNHKNEITKKNIKYILTNEKFKHLLE